jgi:hypothetical protein
VISGRNPANGEVHQPLRRERRICTIGQGHHQLAELIRDRGQRLTCAEPLSLSRP